MIYTIVFYLLLLFITTLINNRKLAISLVVIVSALYMGLRYDYMPDYKAYYDYFRYVSDGYSYWEGDHMEYGWYLLNKIFSPIGFFGFEFLISSLFAFSIGLLLKTFVSKEYLPYVVLGYFSSGVFAMTLSAHRQLVVASVFAIAFVYLVYNNIRVYKDLIRPRLLLYYIIVILLSTIHQSSYFLLIVPFLYFIPKNIISVVAIIALIYATIFIGDIFLPSLLDGLYLNFDRYERILESEIEMQNMTTASFISYTLQIVFIAYAYMNKAISKDHSLVLILCLLTFFLDVSIFSIPQFFRLNMYIGVFTYIAISVSGMSLKDMHNKVINPMPLKIFYSIWILWNSLKVFMIEPGTNQEYKSIISFLFVG